MSTIYEMADEQPGEIAAELIDLYYPDLKLVAARIDYLFAFNDKGAALKLHGNRCAAIARIIKLKDRVMGRGDCEITIDGNHWEDMKLEEKRALIDHELNHFVLKRGPDNKPKFDDINRPEFRSRKHDHDYGWFDIIAQRHGGNAIEVQQVRHLYREYGQTYFPFLSPTIFDKAA